jgi:DNA invertase Pin-like site-specific DNA recombinase
MPAFAYARSDNADVELAVQLDSLTDAGCSDIAIDPTHGRHPRDLRRRAPLLERSQPGDTVTVYRLDCLAVSEPDLVMTIARIRFRNTLLLTADPHGPNSFCNDTIDAIQREFVGPTMRHDRTHQTTKR